MVTAVPLVKVLSDILASQVAAGEVVERPSSVVKELVENSLDAGAKAVLVDIEKGGVALIRVSDDGSGMVREDALLSLERHATSKLRTSADLASILTMGFRGEAVPSIASVAKFRMVTRRAEDVSGTEIIVDGGKLRDVRDAGGAPGTVIEARSLFFNMPARRKFMRAETTEAAHVEQQLRLHALAAPGVRFRFRKDDRVVFDLPGVARTVDRVRQLVENETGGELVAVPERMGPGISVMGFVLSAKHAKRLNRQTTVNVFCAIFASCLLSGFSLSEPAWNYLGVPYPTDSLPEETMPVLPDGENKQLGWPYDPCTISAPRWPGDGPNHYYVAFDGDDRTAGNGGNGNPAAPRRSMPGSGSFPAGTVIFVKGSGKPLPTGPDSNRLSEIEGWAGPSKLQKFNEAGKFDGTSHITWIVGINNPRIATNGDTGMTNSHHVIFDGVVFDASGGADTSAGGRITIRDSKHITFRNGAQYGDRADRGGAMFDLNGTQYVMYYNSEIGYAGNFDARDAKDFHGIRPAYRNRYIWVIDCEIHHLSGDSMQTGNSNNDRPIEETSHYIYFAGNDCHENRENAVDNKNSFHVLVSQNRCHDFTGNGAGGPNGTAIILANDNEGPHSAYHWAIGNEVWDSSHGIRDAGNSATPNKSFMIGNVIRDIAGAGLSSAHSAATAPGTECHIVQNTIARCGQGVNLNYWAPGNPVDVFIRRNLFYDCAKELVVGGKDGLGRYEVVGNVFYKKGHGEVIEKKPDPFTGNLIGEDPLLVNPAANNFSPSAGSVARNTGPQPPEFALFQSLYGIDIRRDRMGTVRPAGASWDVGAIEFNEGK